MPAAATQVSGRVQSSGSSGGTTLPSRTLTGTSWSSSSAAAAGSGGRGGRQSRRDGLVDRARLRQAGHGRQSQAQDPRAKLTHHPAGLRPEAPDRRRPGRCAASAWSSGNAAGVSRSSSMAARKRSRCSATVGCKRRPGRPAPAPAARSPLPRGRHGAAARRPGRTPPAPPRRTRPRRGSGARSGSGGSRRRGTSASRSRTSTRLPSDLLIFSSAKRSMPACIHQFDERPLAGGALRLRDLRLVVREGQVGAAAVDLEARPEVGRCSWPSTRCASPGRPAPHGDGHDGSSGADGCHSTKSSGSRLPGRSGTLPRSLAIGSIASRGRRDSSP